MRKFLIALLMIILIIITYFIVIEGISIAGWNSKSINKIQDLNKNFNEKIVLATEKKQQAYPEKIETLETSIKRLQTTKETYEKKLQYVSDNAELGLIKIKEYKIERLWIALENYAQEENVDLLLNVIENSSAENGNYDLKIAVVGEYINITDFIYDIEKDDTLGFKIENFEIHQYRRKTTTKYTDPDLPKHQQTTEIITSPFELITEIESAAEGADVVGEATDGRITVEEPASEHTISYTLKAVEATFTIKNVKINNINGEFD